jgi:hypothetical protein
VQEIEPRHKKLLYLWIPLFDAKIISKEFFIALWTLVGEKMQGKCIDDDLWVTGCWFLRRNEPKGYVEMAKGLVDSEGWKGSGCFVGSERMQSWFKDMKFNLYEPPVNVKALFDGSKKLEEVLFTKFFEEAPAEDLGGGSVRGGGDNLCSDDDDDFFEKPEPKKVPKKSKKQKKYNPEVVKPVSPELKAFLGTTWLDLNFEKCLSVVFTSDAPEKYLTQVCNNKKLESDELLRKRAAIKAISDKDRKNFKSMAGDLGFTSVLETETFILLMSSEGIHDAVDLLMQLGAKRDQKAELVRVIVKCCTQESPYNPYYTKILGSLITKAKDFRIGAQFSFWDQFRLLEDNSTNPCSTLSKIFSNKMPGLRNSARMLADLLIDGQFNLRVMKNFDLSSEDGLMSKKQILFMRLVIKDLLQKMDFNKLIASAESLKRSDDD